jgi:hypothetical protein
MKGGRPDSNVGIEEMKGGKVSGWRVKREGGKRRRVLNLWTWGKLCCVLVSDVDECSKVPGLCSDGCVNTNGSFNCSCPSGKELNSDMSTCAGMQTVFYMHVLHQAVHIPKCTF